MTTDKLLPTAKYAFVASVSAIGGLAFALFLEVGYPIRSGSQPGWCSSIGWLCHLYEWQTLVAGMIAVLVAFITLRQIRRESQVGAWLKFREMINPYQVAVAHRDRFFEILLYLRELKTIIEDSNDLNRNVLIEECPQIFIHADAKPSIEFNAVYFNAYLDAVKRCDDFNNKCLELATENRLTFRIVLGLVLPLESEIARLNETMIHTVAEGVAEIKGWNEMAPLRFRVTMQDALAPNGYWK